MEAITDFFTQSKENKSLNNNSSNNNQNNNENNKNIKSHYFIGNVIQDELLINKLKLLRKKLMNKYKIQGAHFSNIISSNLIYLGYFTKEVADLYMNKIVSYLCTSIGKKMGNLECKFSNFKLTYDKSYYKIMLQLEDKNNYLKKIIIPFLQKNAVEKIYGRRNYESKASIDLLYFKNSSKIDEQRKRFGKKFKIMLNYPIDQFIMNNLVLLKGTPLESRSGYPSVHDQMEFSVIKEYNFDLHGSLNNNVMTNSNNGMTNSNNEKNNDNREMNNSNNGMMTNSNNEKNNSNRGNNNSNNEKKNANRGNNNSNNGMNNNANRGMMTNANRGNNNSNNGMNNNTNRGNNNSNNGMNNNVNRGNNNSNNGMNNNANREMNNRNN